MIRGDRLLLGLLAIEFAFQAMISEDAAHLAHPEWSLSRVQQSMHDRVGSGTFPNLAGIFFGQPHSMGLGLLLQLLRNTLGLETVQFDLHNCIGVVFLHTWMKIAPKPETRGLLAWFQQIAHGELTEADFKEMV